MTKIMLVEDDNNLREIYQARLEAEGYEIVSAQDGEAALALASKELPDLVISDVMMPKISGFEMLDILRNTEALKNVKIIMLTALGQTEDSERANHLGADKYLVKSQVTLEDIVKATHDLLEGPSAPAVDAPGGQLPQVGQSEPASTPAPADMATPVAPATDSSSDDSPLGNPAPAAPASDPAQLAVQPEPTAAPDASAQDNPTPTLNVVEPPAESEESDNLAGPVAPASDAPLPSVSSSEAEVQEAAPLPAAQEEASINNQIKDFITSTPATAEAAPPVSEAPSAPAVAPEVSAEPQPAADVSTPPPVAAPTDETLVPPAPSEPAPAANAFSSAPITSATPHEDLPDFEPAPEMLNENAPPTITNAGTSAPVASPAAVQPEAEPAPAPAPAPVEPQQDTSDQTPDQNMANALSGLTPGGESEDAPSGQPNVNAPGNHPVEASHVSSDDDLEDTPKKKVIQPLHDLNQKPDLAKLLELEESKTAAQQAARTTGAAPVPGQTPPANQAGAQQPFSAPPVDPNSISL